VRRPPAKHRALMLRTSSADGTSHGGFRWPAEGYVSAPDWSPEPECGHGLHGLLWGQGRGDYLDWSPDALWQAVEIDARTVVDIGGKIKVPHGWVVCTGDRLMVTAYIAEHGGAWRAIVGGTATAGDGGTATAGYGGTATAGVGGTVQIRWWDGTAARYRTAVGYPGEDGIEAGVPYVVRDGKLARKEST
jgi:hypothetical protein